MPEASETWGPRGLGKSKEVDSLVLGKVQGSGSIRVLIRSQVGPATLFHHQECLGVLFLGTPVTDQSQEGPEGGEKERSLACPGGHDGFTLTQVLSPAEDQPPLLMDWVVV